MKVNRPGNKNKADDIFGFKEKIKDNQLETKYKKKTIDDVGYKKIDREDFLNLAISVKKRNIFFVIIMMVMFIMLARVFYLQVVRGDELRNDAEGNRIRIQTIKAARELIYDRNNNVLVKNIPNFRLIVTPGDLPKSKQERDKIFNTLSIINVSPEEIEDKIKQAGLWQSVEILDQLSYDQAIKLMLISSELPGIKIELTALREYTEPEALSHVVGYLGKINQEELKIYQDKDYLIDDYIGKSGIELHYEDVLRGVNGRKQIEVDSLGKEMKIIAEQKAVPGDNLVLSLDLGLQKKAYEVLSDYVKQRNAKGGALIALDPRNGEVLSLVSWPGFNINDFVKGIKQEDYTALLEDERKPLFNRAISGEYPPGSTFKLVMASAALQEGVVTKDTTVESTGGIQLNILYKDWKKGGHGITNITKAIAESVNTYFYIAGGGIYNQETNKIEGGLGIDRIHQYAKAFGLGAKTGIDLAGEKEGFFPTREWKEARGETWYIGDTYNVSIGQGDILTTPIQVANFTAVVANGGILYEPHLVKNITGVSNKQTVMPKVINQNFISKSNIEIVKQGMREAVIYGSARSLQTVPVHVAAKTGTAQHSGSDVDHSWLTAFAPYESPEIVITVIVEQGGESTEAALPVAKDVLNWYFSLKNG